MIEHRGGHNRKTTAELRESGSYRPWLHRAREEAEQKQQSALISLHSRNRSRVPSVADLERWTPGWIRGDFDKRANDAGYWFDAERGSHAVWWIERYCRLYEGAWAGQSLVLRGAWEDWPRDPIADEWDSGGLEASISRAEAYSEAVAAGARCDWQYECTMRVFGWCHHDEEWSAILNREAWTRRFKRAGIWVPKKNKKSPTLAAWGLYLTAGDGEKGAKVFTGAKDGQQARKIACEHAQSMIEQSDKLAGAFTINKAKARFTHDETRSYMEPLAAGTSRSQEASEGRNGSLLVDETHVVDRKFMTTNEQMGASREEAIVAQFSTAGDDPEGYGKEEWDYGRDVERGAVEDHTYFFLNYGAPLDITDADIAADVVGVAEKCNPAWGHTIRKSEIKQAHTTLSRTLAGLGNFKRYRLNIWLKASNTVLLIPTTGDWAACKSERTLASFAGCQCWGGLDLSKSRDMSAFTVTFAEEDEFYQFVWCWMSSEYADKYQHKVKFRQWEKDGSLYLSETRTIDQRDVKEVIEEVNGQTPLNELRHDEYYGAQLALQLVDAGIKCVAFPQTIKHYAQPTGEFQALVKERRIHHDGNPVYAWQIGHATIRPDVNNNIRVQKPSDDDYRKVDIVQAGIMSLSGAMATDENRSVYRDRGPLYVGDDDG